MTMLTLAQTGIQPWWDVTAGGMLGGIGGAAFGIIGAAVGAACGVLLPRGKGLRSTIWVVRALAALGVLVLITGGVALATGQPYHVWYPLLLLGGIAGAVFGSATLWLPVVVRQIELRKMQATDFRKGG